MLAQGREALARFVRGDLAERARTVAAEVEFEFRRGRNHVKGRWDRIDERPEGIALVDYKTSAVEDETRAEERARVNARDGQLGLYALAYRETRGVVPARLELRFVGSGTIGGTTVEPEDLERAELRIDEAAEGIREARFDATPEPRVCAHCDYRQVCRFSAARRAP